MFANKQFEFRPKLSTGKALPRFTNNILQNNGRFTGAAFLDLSKAFHTVDQLLLQKLTDIGLANSIT